LSKLNRVATEFLQSMALWSVIKVDKPKKIYRQLRPTKFQRREVFGKAVLVICLKQILEASKK